MSTPHNQAEKGQIAEIVLMPGDPLRAQYIARKYLKDAFCFNTIRSMFGYTGWYDGQRISVMGSGMGMPSIGIYSHELFSQYDVKAIIRIGTAGGYTEKEHVFDLLLADSCWSKTSYASVFNHDENALQFPDPALNGIIEDCAGGNSLSLKKARIHSSDVFYCQDDSSKADALENGCSAVEMESFALFANAAALHKQAACLLSISDSFVYDEEATPQQREQNLDQMIELALQAAARWQRQEGENHHV